MLLNIGILLALTVNYVNCVTLVVHRNDLPEESKAIALATVLTDLESGLTLNLVSDKLVTQFVNKYGGQWFSTISTTQFVSTFEAQPHSLIWFSYDNVNVVLFRPGLQTPAELLYGAKQILDNVTLVATEMRAS